MSLAVDMVQFGMKIEPNQTELLAKFKIRTELFAFRTELNYFKPS